MIEIISDLPDHVIGITAKGNVTGTDYESVIIPLVEEKLKKHPKVSLFYHIGHEFTGMDAEAMWEDTKVGLRHFKAWEKIAVVSDVDWIRWAMNIFGVAMPGQVRMFANDQLAEARKWVSE
jgi:hypothetical protein